MAVSLRIRNYQAIADAKLEIQGFTVVTGRSNLGKTALIRAVSAMMYGIPGEFFIKHNEAWVGGSMLIDDPKEPLKILWRKVHANKRKPGLQPALEINGKTYTKIGRDHKKLTAPYGIMEIETTAARLRPQVAMQHDSIFLAAETETTVAEVFKLLGRVDIITDAQKFAKKDYHSTEGELKVRSKDRVTLEGRVSKTDYVPVLRTRLEALRQLAAQVEASNELRFRQIALLKELQGITPLSLPSLPVKPSKPLQLSSVLLLKELTGLSARTMPTPPSLPPRRGSKELTLLKDLRIAQSDLKRVQAELQAKESETNSLLAEKTQLEADLKVCPVCDRGFDANHQATV